jgi:ribonuclease P protein component
VSLPKKHRLKNWRNFQTVYSKGRFYRGVHLTLKALDTSKLIKLPNPSELSQEINQHLPPTCLGIAISKKVSKKAVVRNRLKRLIKACFRELLPMIKPGWQLIIMVRSSAIECEYEHFLRELKKLFIQAGMINGH